jgi:hypothetical protein
LYDDRITKVLAKFFKLDTTYFGQCDIKHIKHIIHIIIFSFIFAMFLYSIYFYTY